LSSAEHPKPPWKWRWIKDAAIASVGAFFLGYAVGVVIVTGSPTDDVRYRLARPGGSCGRLGAWATSRFRVDQVRSQRPDTDRRNRRRGLRCFHRDRHNREFLNHPYRHTWVRGESVR